VANYVKATNFAAKDALVTTDPAKIIKGTEIDNEYNAIASAVSSKADSNSPTLTGTPLAPTAAPGTNTTQIATTAFVAASTGNATNIAGGGANRVVFQSALDTTSFAVAPTVAGTYLGWTGSAFAWSTVSASTSAALTINNSGSGASSGATFNGSLPVTISYNTVGAPSTSGTGATGTWGISITGSSGSTSFATTAGSASTATVASGLTGTPAITVSTVTTPTIASSGATITLSPGGSAKIAVNTSNIFFPNSDNSVACGSGSNRWSIVYAANGTINTSDANEKQQIQDVTAAEKAVGQALKGMMKSFKFNDAVAKKGDGARIHFGIIAQDVKAAFEAQGLDAEKYGVFCSDTWYEVNGKTNDSNSNMYTKDSPGAVERTRLGVRYDELFALIIGSL
jgi:hypothetical protein